MEKAAAPLIPAHYTYVEMSRGVWAARITLLDADLTEESANSLLQAIKERVACEEISLYPPRHTIYGQTAWKVNVVNPTSPTITDREAWVALCLEVGIEFP